MVTRELRSAEQGRRPPPLMLVAAGGSIGALTRHGALTLSGDTTLAVLTLNVMGSLLLGGLTAWGPLQRTGTNGTPIAVDRWTALVGLGFCGGLTTFSAHVLQVAASFDDGAWSRGLTSLAATAVLTIAAAVVGHTIVSRRMEPFTSGAPT